MPPSQGQQKQHGTPLQEEPLLEQRLSYRFALIAARFAQFTAAAHRDRHGLPASGWWVLSVIGRFGPMSAREVSERTALDQFKVSRTIDQLEKKGWISRKLNRQDRRRVVLRLTPSGEATVGDIEGAVRAIEGELTSVLSSRERKALFRALDKIDARIAQARSEPPPGTTRPHATK